MATTQTDPASAASPGGHIKSHSTSASLRVLSSNLRPKTGPTTPGPGDDPIGPKLALPKPQSPRVRRSSAPEEPTLTNGWGADAFVTPQESDAEFVRRTYEHFSIAGVPDDGFVDGKEYTREKTGLSAWEEAALSRPNSVVPPRRQPEPQTPPLLASEAMMRNPSGSMRNGVNGHPPHTTETSGSSQPFSSQRSRHDSVEAAPRRPTIPASYSGDTTRSTATFLSTNERRRRQEIADKKKEELIANIDRYGFFAEGSSSAHHKAVLLPSSLFVASLPKKGAKGLAAQGSALPTSLTSQTKQGGDLMRRARSAAEVSHRQREQERIAKWTRMLTVKGRDQGHNAVGFDFANGVNKKLRRRIYKGIPDSWRSAAWAALIQYRASTNEGQQAYSLAQPHITTAVAPDSISLSRPDESYFEQLKSTPCQHDVQIDLDVPRTISGHVQFHTRYGQGQRSLFHVLHAISMLCDQCGYCQGMGPIAATLLCYLSPERAYAAMVALHNHVNLHAIFSPGFPALVENLYVQDQVLRKFMPEIARVFDDQMMVASSYATKWYITLFSNTIPFETQLRVWDIWLLEGQDVVVLVAVAIIWAHRGVVLGKRADFEVVLSALSSFFVPEDDDALLWWVRDAMARKDVRGLMRKAREEYRVKVKSGEAAALML